MTDELAGLREDVREACIQCSRWLLGSAEWSRVRAELIRLAHALERAEAENANLLNELELTAREVEIHEDACDKAEAELAAMKRRIAEAPVQVYGRDDWHEPLIGHRVALLELEGDEG